MERHGSKRNRLEENTDTKTDTPYNRARRHNPQWKKRTTSHRHLFKKASRKATLVARLKVPDEFQPARLFLDDIEEIARILVDAIQLAKVQILTFRIKDRVCDEVQELPKIAKKTSKLWIKVDSPNFGPNVSLSFNDNGSLLSCYGLKEAEELKLFQKLAPIFERRKLRLRTFVWSHYWNSVAALFGACVAVLGLLVIFILKPDLIRHPMRAIVGPLLLLLPIIALGSTLSYHSIIVMRPSSEPSPLRQELLHKFPLVAISSALTFLLTLLGLYLKHKYWP